MFWDRLIGRKKLYTAKDMSDSYLRGFEAGYMEALMQGASNQSDSEEESEEVMYG